ncbi:hypothetical protein AAF712_010187 [Marasmius tenuissimus]|uniref:Uncharacterized protein n=1 Tax=Marasmius tenuissimus TaxID=585030 RepID=A0ABR2ZMN6_9AGAR
MPKHPKLITDPFQSRITDHFNVRKTKHFPPPTLIERKIVLVFWLADGRRKVLTFEGVAPPRMRLSDYTLTLARLGVQERPQFRVLHVEDSSYSWGYLGWREYFETPKDETPRFFHMSNDIDNLPDTWYLDVFAYTEAL